LTVNGSSDIPTDIAGGARRRSLVLRSAPTAPGLARAFLTDTCRDWHAEQYIDHGCLVLSELVTNAVRYAGTDIAVELSLNGRGLTLAVGDRGRGEPHLIPPESRTIGGCGLAIVDRVANEWGVRPRRTGGKTVWCELTRRPTRQGGERKGRPGA